MKRLFFITIYFFSTGVFLFARGEQNMPTDPSKPYQGIVLNALMEGHPTTEAIQQLLPEFEAMTGIRVNIEILPFEEMTAKAYLTLSTKSQEYDIYMDAWGQGVAWATDNLITDLTPFMKELSAPYFDESDYVVPFFKHAQLDGKQYGLPVYGESTFFYYRKDIFKTLGLSVPKTMQELWNACKTIKEQDDGKIYPITLRGKQGIHAVYIWSTFLWAFGGSWLDDSGRLVINSPEAVKATQFYADLLNNFGPPGYANFGWTENRVAFTSGKAAMSIDATVNGAYNEDPKGSTVVGKVGYAASPVDSQAIPKGGANSLAAHYLYMNGQSRNKEAAWLFMTWALNGKTQTASQEIKPNSGATSYSAMNSPVYQTQFGAFRDGMLEALENGNPDYLIAIPGSKEIYDKVGRALSLVLAGTESAEKALNDVTQDLNASLNLD